MKFYETPVKGVFKIGLEERGDDRGFFARAFCAEEFAAHGLETQFVQANVSRSTHKGTLRGMHYQLGTSAEVKLVRCTAGALFDVALDLRPDSPSFGQWFGAELTADNHEMLYIPRGCAHGFLSLSDDAEVFYLVSAPYSPQDERGVRYDDPRFAIAWPAAAAHISAKDAAHPDYSASFHGADRLRGFV
jgi:dTDP-4-dehydrorhamnose 3,5-epimerase